MINGMIIDELGNECWYKDGKLHREDGPALIYSYGNKEYWLNNKCLSKEEWWNRLSHEMRLKVLFDVEES
jgi:hypothetical protein